MTTTGRPNDPTDGRDDETTKFMSVKTVGGSVWQCQLCCMSTEEMIAAIEEVNRITDKEDITIFSIDISAMYPSLDIPTVAKVAAEEFLASDLDLCSEDLVWQCKCTMNQAQGRIFSELSRLASEKILPALSYCAGFCLAAVMSAN